MPVTRTSLPGGALVPSANRCSASRLCRAYRSSTARSTAGRQVELRTGGTANTTSRISSGEMLASSTTVTPTRTIQPIVLSSDMYMWSSTNTWVRRTDEPVEVVAALVVLQPDDTRLEPCDVGLQRDRHPIAEPPGEAVGQDLEQPGQRAGDGDRADHHPHQRHVAGDEGSAEHGEPEGEERVRQRSEQGRAPPRRRPGAARGCSRAGRAATSTTRRAEWLGRGRRLVAAQERTSNNAPSSSIVAVNRRACRSNIVR